MKRYCGFVTSERVCGNPDQIRVALGLNAIGLMKWLLGQSLQLLPRDENWARMPGLCFWHPGFLLSTTSPTQSDKAP